MMLKKALKPFLIVISILLLIFVRFLYLNEFPVGILNDEVDVTLSAKTYWEFGKDLSGVPFPKSLFVTKTWASLSGLPSLLLAPIYRSNDLTPFSIRLPFVFLSIAISILISLIVLEITKKRKLTLIVFFVSLINPWLFFYSRQPTEAPFSLLFALIGIYIFFKLKNFNILYSLPFFTFSFFSYFGAKPVIPVLMIFLTALHWWKIKNVNKISYILMIVSSVLLVLVYIFISKNMDGNTLSQRQDQLIFLNVDKYASVVNEARKSSIEFPLKNLFYNKYTVLFNVLSQKFLGPFSINYLFLTGDSIVPFAEHGVLYLPDLIFIIIGFSFLVKSKNDSDKLILSIVIILLVSGAVGPAISLMGNQFVFRAFLHIPAYILLISYGLYKFPYIYTIPLYLIFYINFVCFFFFRYSIDQQDNHFITEKVLSGYIIRNKNLDKTIKISAEETDRIFYQYAFFDNLYSNLKKLPEYKEETEIIQDKILFSKRCPIKNDTNSIIIVESKLDCGDIDSKYIVIQSQKDAGVKYKIYNDSLCNYNDLTVYRREHLISDYDIEKMTDKQFCNRWIQNGKTN